MSGVWVLVFLVSNSVSFPMAHHSHRLVSSRVVCLARDLILVSASVLWVWVLSFYSAAFGFFVSIPKVCHNHLMNFCYKTHTVYLSIYFVTA